MLTEFYKAYQKDSKNSSAFINKGILYFYMIATIICLSLAFIYLKYRFPVYKATATVLINVNSAKYNRSLLKPINSNSGKPAFNSALQNDTAKLNTHILLHSTIDALPWNISYYRAGLIKDVEIDKSASPVQISISRPDADELKNKSMKIVVASSKSYKLSFDHTNGTYAYGQTVKADSQEFKITKSKNFTTNTPTIIIRFNNADFFIKQFNNKLHIQPGEKYDNTLKLTVQSNTPGKGVAFLKKLISNYNAERQVDDYSSITAVKTIDDSLSKLGNYLVNLTEQSADNIASKMGITADVDQQKRTALNQNLKVFEALEVYANVPIAEFSLIPDTYKHNNISLAKLIDTFNNLQTYKQHVLNVKPVNRTQLSQITQRLLLLQNTISESIDTSESQIRDTLNLSSAKSDSYGKPSLAKQNTEFVELYSLLIKKRAERTKILFDRRRLIAIDPIYAYAVPSHSVFIYALAIIIPVLLTALMIALKVKTPNDRTTPVT